MDALDALSPLDDLPSPPEPPETGDLRTMMGEVLQETATKGKIRDLIDQCLSMNGLVYVYCPDCRKRLQAEYPDVKKRADALMAFTSEAWGKPKEGESMGTTIIVERPSRG